MKPTSPSPPGPNDFPAPVLSPPGPIEDARRRVVPPTLAKTWPAP